MYDYYYYVFFIIFLCGEWISPVIQKFGAKRIVLQNYMYYIFGSLHNQLINANKHLSRIGHNMGTHHRTGLINTGWERFWYVEQKCEVPPQHRGNTTVTLTLKSDNASRLTILAHYFLHLIFSMLMLTRGEIFPHVG